MKLERDAVFSRGASFFRDGENVYWRFQADASSAVIERVTDAKKAEFALEWKSFVDADEWEDFTPSEPDEVKSTATVYDNDGDVLYEPSIRPVSDEHVHAPPAPRRPHLPPPPLPQTPMPQPRLLQLTRTGGLGLPRVRPGAVVPPLPPLPRGAQRLLRRTGGTCRAGGDRSEMVPRECEPPTRAWRMAARCACADTVFN